MLNKQQIQHLALQEGFKLKKQPDGSMDLNPYVYDLVYSVINIYSTRKEFQFTSKLRLLLNDITQKHHIYLCDWAKQLNCDNATASHYRADTKILTTEHAQALSEYLKSLGYDYTAEQLQQLQRESEFLPLNPTALDKILEGLKDEKS